jgi:hypothetical protein
MADQPDAHQASHGAPVRHVLPSRLASQDVQVRGALSRLQELRSAVRVCEWMVEPVADTDAFSLTLVLSENVSLSFLLTAEDAQDLGVTLAQPGPAAEAS